MKKLLGAGDSVTIVSKTTSAWRRVRAGVRLQGVDASDQVLVALAGRSRWSVEDEQRLISPGLQHPSPSDRAVFARFIVSACSSDPQGYILRVHLRQINR